MKILLLVAGGRAGSDFFQSLLDGHSQILQFPGILVIDDNFNEMLDLENPSEILKKFISLNLHFFNSKLNTLERHNRLGKKRNKFFTVSKKKFIKNFYRLAKEKRFSTKLEILKNLHIAYALAKKDKIEKKKIILIHTHLIDYTKKFLKIINEKNITIIHTMRHPMSAISSPVKNWLHYENGWCFFPRDLYFQIDKVFNGIFNLLSLKKKIYMIQLEKLHCEHKKVMSDFCKIFKIKYEKCLGQSTYLGLQWWGDEVSNKWITGINKNFKVNIDNKLFFLRDIHFLENLAADIIKSYKYNFILKNKKKNYFNLLPLKCELLVWKNTFKHRRIKHMLSIPYFYLKRILLINKFVINLKYFPYSIGSK